MRRRLRRIHYVQGLQVIMAEPVRKYIATDSKLHAVYTPPPADIRMSASTPAGDMRSHTPPLPY